MNRVVFTALIDFVQFVNFVDLVNFVIFVNLVGFFQSCRFYLFCQSCRFLNFITEIFNILGYDGVPVEAMQALDINEGHYGHAYHNGGSDINYENEVPNPPQDNNQVAAWYDTDL